MHLLRNYRGALLPPYKYMKKYLQQKQQQFRQQLQQKLQQQLQQQPQQLQGHFGIRNGRFGI